MNQYRRPHFRKPDQRKEEKDDQLIYGIRAVMEAVHAGKEIERIFITRGAGGELMNSLKSLLKEKGIVWQDVPIEKIHRITRNNHQDVVCYISSISYDNLSQVIPLLFERGETPLVLILDRVTDVRNFGAIARTAECAGVNTIVIPSRGSAQITADAIKTSAGALNRVSVCRENNLKHTISFLQESGLRVVAASEKGKKNLFEADLTGPLAIVMGSEEDGVSGDIIRVSDELLRIPLMGNIGSLNVSVATGIFLFETIRQRMNN